MKITELIFFSTEKVQGLLHYKSQKLITAYWQEMVAFLHAMHMKIGCQVNSDVVSFKQLDPDQEYFFIDISMIPLFHFP